MKDEKEQTKKELLGYFSEISKKYDLGWGSDTEIRNLILRAFSAGFHIGKIEAYKENEELAKVLT